MIKTPRPGLFLYLTLVPAFRVAGAHSTYVVITCFPDAETGKEVEANLRCVKDGAGEDWLLYSGFFKDLVDRGLVGQEWETAKKNSGGLIYQLWAVVTGVLSAAGCACDMCWFVETAPDMRTVETRPTLVIIMRMSDAIQFHAIIAAAPTNMGRAEWMMESRGVMRLKRARQGAARPAAKTPEQFNPFGSFTKRVNTDNTATKTSDQSSIPAWSFWHPHEPQVKPQLPPVFGARQPLIEHKALTAVTTIYAQARHQPTPPTSYNERHPSFFPSAAEEKGPPKLTPPPATNKRRRRSSSPSVVNSPSPGKGKASTKTGQQQQQDEAHQKSMQAATGALQDLHKAVATTRADLEAKTEELKVATAKNKELGERVEVAEAAEEVATAKCKELSERLESAEAAERGARDAITALEAQLRGKETSLTSMTADCQTARVHADRLHLDLQRALASGAHKDGVVSELQAKVQTLEAHNQEKVANLTKSALAEIDKRQIAYDTLKQEACNEVGRLQQKCTGAEQREGATAARANNVLAALNLIRANHQPPPFMNGGATLRQMTLERFIWVKQIGQGGFGEVWLVVHPTTGKEYVAKVIKKTSLACMGPVSKYEETATMQRYMTIGSPYLIYLKASLQEPDRIVIITDFVRGGNMREVFSSMTGPMPVSILRMFSAQTGSGIRDLHRANVVHRDLKLENLLLNAEAHVTLIDTGLAAVLLPGHTSNVICGDPWYMAPEMHNGAPYGYRVDWWAYGVIIMLLSVGNLPWEQLRDLAVCRDIITQFDVRQHLANVQMDADLKLLITGLLHPDPTMRLGAGGWDEIRAQPFFASLAGQWGDIDNRRIPIVDPSSQDMVTFISTMVAKTGDVMGAFAGYIPNFDYVSPELTQ